MNKNSKYYRSQALKNKKNGSPSQFLISKTMPGGSLSTRTLTITIGNCKRKSVKAKVAASRSKQNFQSDE